MSTRTDVHTLVSLIIVWVCSNWGSSRMRYLTINGYHVIALFQVLLFCQIDQECGLVKLHVEVHIAGRLSLRFRMQHTAACICVVFALGSIFFPPVFDRKGFGHIMTFMMNCVAGNLWLQKLFRIITMEIG